MREEEEKFCV